MRNGQLAARSCAQRLNSIPVENVATALLLVSLRQGVLIAPRYVHTLAPSDLFLVAVSNPNCRFDEYLYAARPAENPARSCLSTSFLPSAPWKPPSDAAPAAAEP